MSSSFTGNLKGNEEYIFRQSVMGSVGHIVNNYDDFLELINGPEGVEIRIDTLCGRNYKYGNYSSMDARDHVVRNACEYCFTEYDPDERTDESQQRKRERREADRKRHLDTGLPF